MEVKNSKKCKFFSWTVIHKRLNTMDLIQKRYPNSCFNLNWCISWKFAVENINHIFIHCAKARSIWKKNLDEIGFSMQDSIAKSICHTLCAINQNSIYNILKFNVTLAALWTLWLDRNNMIFNEIQSSFYSSWKNVCNLVGMWLSKHRLFKDYNQSTIFLNLNALST